MVLLRKINKWFPLKIPLLFTTVELAAIINDWLGKYPKVNN